MHCDLDRVPLTSKMGKMTPFTTHKKKEKEKNIFLYINDTFKH